MSGWVFAQGKEAEQTLGDVVTAGATQIALAGADGIFSVGELLFISEADASEAEFLGAVTIVTSSTVDFTLALQKSKDTGAKLWRPVASLSLGAEVATPLERRVNPGLSVERSLGGVFYAIQSAEPATTMQWVLEGLTPATEEALIAWLDGSAQGGLLPFTLVAPTRKIEAVRLDQDGYARITRAGGRQSVKLMLQIEADGEYR